VSALFWLGLFFGSAVVGYIVLRAVPPLLHTPLMSGMNALSGITILAALAAVGLARTAGEVHWAGAAVALAAANVVGGFAVTHRMLRMFRRPSDREHPS